MKLRVMSDLHLDCDIYYNNPPFNIHSKRNDRDETVLILAGDLCQIADSKIHFDRFFRFINSQCGKFRHVIFVPGNHEYYGEPMAIIDRAIAGRTKHLQNFSFLQRGSVVLDDYEFIGATLWTDVNRANPVTEYLLPLHMVSDFEEIRLVEERRKLSITEWKHLHKMDLEYIEHRLADKNDTKKIVVSHHLPSWNCVDEKFKNAGHSNYGFYSDLDRLFHEYDIELWIHGHSHESVLTKVNNTPIISNPRGYEGNYVNHNFDPYYEYIL